MTYKDWVTEENILRISAWARDGLTDADIAKNIGIARSTFCEWKKKNNELSDALKKSKEVADIVIENALYKRATGYSVMLKKTFKVKDVIYENGKKIKETERLVEGYDEMHVPADTTAQIFWLKNRKPNEWRDKREVAMDTNFEDLTPLVEMLRNKKDK